MIVERGCLVLVVVGGGVWGGGVLGVGGSRWCFGWSVLWGGGGGGVGGGGVFVVGWFFSARGGGVWGCFVGGLGLSKERQVRYKRRKKGCPMMEVCEGGRGNHATWLPKGRKKENGHAGSSQLSQLRQGKEVKGFRIVWR